MRACLLVLLCAALSAEVIDRIELTVGRQVITEVQIEEEIRVTAFLNESQPNYADGERRAAAGRLVDQALIVREMEFTRFAPDESKQAAEFLARLEQQEGKAAFEKRLESYGLTRDVLTRHLVRQFQTLQFISFRFRPDMDLPGSEQQRSNDQRQVVERQTDMLLNEWLTQARTQVRVRYLDKTLEPAPNQAGQ